MDFSKEEVIQLKKLTGLEEEELSKYDPKVLSTFVSVEAYQEQLESDMEISVAFIEAIQRYVTGLTLISNTRDIPSSYSENFKGDAISFWKGVLMASKGVLKVQNEILEGCIEYECLDHETDKLFEHQGYKEKE